RSHRSLHSFPTRRSSDLLRFSLTVARLPCLAIPPRLKERGSGGEVFSGTMSIQIHISHIYGNIISPLRGSGLPLGNNHFSIEMSPLRGFDLRWGLGGLQ